MADLRTAMADVIQCHDVHTREAQEAMADAILALPEMQAMLAEIVRLRADPTIYKHQCGHCSRLSPLPFLVPGYLLEARRG